MIQITWRLVKSEFMDKKSWILMFVMPLLFTLIFGGLASGDDNSIPKVGLLVEGQPTVQGEVLLEVIEDNEALDIRRGDESELKQQLKGQELLGIIKVNQHWTHKENQPITLIKNLETSEFLAMERNLKQKIASIQQNFIMMEKQGQKEAIQLLKKETVPVVIKNKKGQETNIVDDSSIRAVGFIAMFVMMTVIVAGGVILQEKEEGTWARLNMSPLSTFNMMTGFLCGLFLIGLLQFSILIGASSLIFNVEWGNLLAVCIMVVMFLLVAVSIGLFLSTVVQTNNQQQAIGGFFVVITCMIGGVFWPIDIISNTMQKLAHFVPQFWIMDGLKQVMFNHANWLDILPQSGMLLIFAIIFFGCSIICLHVQRKID